jgi:hypothetical protein
MSNRVFRVVCREGSRVRRVLVGEEEMTTLVVFEVGVGFGELLVVYTYVSE